MGSGCAAGGGGFFGGRRRHHDIAASSMAGTPTRPIDKFEAGRKGGSPGCAIGRCLLSSLRARSIISVSADLSSFFNIAKG